MKKQINRVKLWKGALLLLCLSFSNLICVFGNGDGLPRGAYKMPYTRYESEDGSKGGGAVAYESTNFDQDEIASEASNQKYVGLPSNGSFVEWTVGETGDGVTLRFTMPDNETTGEGNNGSLDIYVNGVFDQTVQLTSRYAYQYFTTSTDKCEQIKAGTDKTRMRFDETHFILNNKLSAGDVIRISKSNGDAFEYGIDFVEIEEVPAIKAAPANSLSVVDYGANGNDEEDDLAAFHACLDAADAAGMNVYIPEGKYYLSAKLNFNVENLTFQGAGIWYTELYFSTDLQFSGGIYARCSNVVISDFYLHTANNDRWNYNEPYPEGSIGEYKTYKGFMGTYGENSTISNVWVEHFECGAWIAGYDAPLPVDITTNLTMTGMRIRNNYADGVNFCQGTNNSTVEYSSIRNEGDDALAVWPNNAMGVETPGSNNTFRYNTIENQWRAGGTALFGASGHQVHHNIYKDGFASSAIRLTTDFNGYKFDINEGINIYENTIIGYGTSDDLWNAERGAIELNATSGGIFNVTFENIDIYNSQRNAIQIGSGGGYSGIEFYNINVDGTGLDGQTDATFTTAMKGTSVLAYATSGEATFYNLAYNNVANDNFYYNASSGFTLNFETIGDISITGVNLPNEEINIVVGEEVDITPEFTPENATNKVVTWSSSNEDVAIIDAGSQTLTGLSVGSTVITVTTEDGGFTDNITVNVSAAVVIEATDDEANEGGDTASFTISIDELSSDITIPYTISGTASSSDYTASPVLYGSITLSPSALSQTIVISPLDDSDFEGTETLTITLEEGSGYVLSNTVSAGISIADNDNPPCAAPNISMVSNGPSIDQNIDALWDEQGSNAIANAVVGSIGNFKGTYKAVFDDENLYVLVQTVDANLYNDSGSDWWSDDVIGIYLNGDNSKGSSYDGLNDFQLGFRYSDSEIHLGGNSVQSTTGIDFEMYNNGSGLTLEVAIPWSTIGITPEIGNQIGIDVICDVDNDGGDRDAQIAAFATTEMAWSDPSLFGTAYLTSCGDVLIADAGTNQMLAAGTTSTTLDGSASSGADGFTYSWTQVAGSTVSINDFTSANPTISGLEDGNTYSFQLEITFDSQTSTDVVQVVVNDDVTPITVTGITVEPTTVSLSVGATQLLSATITPSDATDQTVTWSTNDSSVVTVSNGTIKAVGVGTTNVIATSSNGLQATCAVTVDNLVVEQTPYGGIAWALPGTIEIENFDEGGQNVAYYDTDDVNNGGAYRTSEAVDVETCDDGGYNIGWTNAGEWLEYTVDVAEAGNYDFEIRVASTLDAGTFHIEFDGVDVTGTITSVNTGAWQTWSSVTVSDVTLSAGEQIMRVVLDNPNNNFDKIIIAKSTDDDSDDVVAGDIYFIKNRWQETYLYDNGDNVGYASFDNSEIYQWQLIQLSDGYYELQNVATEEYMHIEDLTGSVQCTARTDGWYSSRWAIEEAGDGYIYFRNAWQTSYYIHIEDVLGYAQYGTIDSSWMSAIWSLEPILKSARISVKSTKSETIKLYPNPVMQSVTVECGRSDIKSLEIFDLMGQSVYKYRNSSASVSTIINVSSIKPGIYLMRIELEDGVFEVQRFVKE